MVIENCFEFTLWPVADDYCDNVRQIGDPVNMPLDRVEVLVDFPGLRIIDAFKIENQAQILTGADLLGQFGYFFK